MKNSLFFLTLPLLAAALPQNKAGEQFQRRAQDGNSQQLSDSDKQTIQSAIDAWSSDTGTVSNFLDNSASFAKNQATFVNQANVANSAEIDELTHKQVLDQFLTNNPDLDKANKTLTAGAFQLVVDQLQVGVDKGPGVASDITDAINNDRCIDVLPNIDTYLSQAGKLIGASTTKSAIRPSACAQVSAAVSAGGKNFGFQGNPPPQAAIDALRTSSSNSNSTNDAVKTAGAKQGAGNRAQQSAVGENNAVDSASSTTAAAKGGAGTRAQQSALAENNAVGSASTTTAAPAKAQATGAGAASKTSAVKAAGASKTVGAEAAATTGGASAEENSPRKKLGKLFGGRV